MATVMIRCKICKEVKDRSEIHVLAKGNICKSCAREKAEK